MARSKRAAIVSPDNGTYARLNGLDATCVSMEIESAIESCLFTDCNVIATDVTFVVV